MWRLRRPFKTGPLSQALDDFRTRTCRQVAEAYRALLEGLGGAIPSKNGVDLRGFATVMPDLALTAIIKPDRCMYRLAGENLKLRIGLNPIGRNYYDFVPSIRREQAIRAMNMVIDIPCAFRAEIEQIYSDGQTRMVEAVGFPLSSEEPGVDGFILFGDRQIDYSPVDPIVGPALSGANVLRRDLIDLGFGVDDGFEDMVPL